MGFLPVAGGILSGIGGIVQSNQNSHNQQQMQQMIQQIMQNGGQVDQQMLNAITGLQNQAGQYGSVLPGLTSAMQSEAGGAGAQAPGAASSYINNAMNPNALAAATGINAGGLTSAATSYLSNPNGTNLSQASPGAMSFYQNEAQNGLNPQVATNAQNQLQQQFGQSQAAIRQQAAPGQNLNAESQAAQNSLLSNSTNLGAQLAGQDQQFRNIGEAGALSTATGLDAQKQQMLTGAAQLGTNYNQTVLGDQAAGAGFGQQILAALQNFAGQGNQLNEFGISSLGSLGQQYNQQGEYYSGLASSMPQPTNPFSAFGNALAGIPSGGGSSGGFNGGSITGTPYDLPLQGLGPTPGPSLLPTSPQVPYPTNGSTMARM